jgi:hypothetical protein
MAAMIVLNTLFVIILSTSDVNVLRSTKRSIFHCETCILDCRSPSAGLLEYTIVDKRGESFPVRAGMLVDKRFMPRVAVLRLPHLISMEAVQRGAKGRAEGASLLNAGLVSLSLDGYFFRPLILSPHHGQWEIGSPFSLKRVPSAAIGSI